MQWVTWTNFVLIKCTLVQALGLCTGCTAHMGSRGVVLPFHDHGTRRGWGVNFTPRPLFTTVKDLVSIVWLDGWAPGPVWTGAENLASTGIRSPHRPARSQSLYRLRYHFVLITLVKKHGEGNILIWSFDRFDVNVWPKQCLLDCFFRAKVCYFTFISNFVDTCKRKKSLF